MNEVDEAKKLLQEAANKEIEQCGKDIQKALAKYSCELVASTAIVGEAIQQSVVIRKKG